MTFGYDLWLVLLSLVVAVQGAFAGLSFARQLAGRQDHYRSLLAGATATLTTAIWSMHFIGMLAMRLPVPTNYLVLPTVLSALIAVFFVGASIFVAASFPSNWAMLWIAAVIMGTGIVAMHFTGMTALHAMAMIDHDPMLVVASWVVGVSASSLAMRYAFTDHGRTPVAWASLALGLAISGMHYTAMAGMVLHPVTNAGTSGEMSISPDALAVVVALVAFGLSAVFLLMLVPEHPRAGAAGGIQSAVLAHSPGDLAVAGGARPQLFREAALTEQAAQLVDASAGLTSAPEPGGRAQGQAQAAFAAGVLPVRQHGTLRNLPVGQVHAVKADAHYTWVFDGRDSHFCGLSIAEVEARLQPQLFARVHRSHLVALARIARFKKSGDGGTVELDSEVPYSLPVSRRQIATVKAGLIP
jgi:diguanylate cyclase